MMNRILSLIGWLGTALAFVAVAIRFGYPAKAYRWEPTKGA